MDYDRRGREAAEAVDAAEALDEGLQVCSGCVARIEIEVEGDLQGLGAYQQARPARLASLGTADRILDLGHARPGQASQVGAGGGPAALDGFAGQRGVGAGVFIEQRGQLGSGVCAVAGSNAGAEARIPPEEDCGSYAGGDE